jgi:hypothetical protein
MMQEPKTVQEAIAQFEARLVDRLPHAIEAGCEGPVIALLKMWGAWHSLYPVDRAIQAMLHSSEHNKRRRPRSHLRGTTCEALLLQVAILADQPQA